MKRKNEPWSRRLVFDGGWVNEEEIDEDMDQPVTSALLVRAWQMIT